MNVEEIFQLALKKQTAVEREAFLDGACDNNLERRSRVEALLASHEQVGSFLEKPVFEGEQTAVPSLNVAAGTTIGSYKILQQIGEGGFGVVYMAEQQEPVVRKVALKIIKPGMDTKEVVARFEAERQALAMMDHPNIAHVFDGGETDSGRPYFIMELVRGVPLTEYCDRNDLTTNRRLQPLELHSAAGEENDVTAWLHNLLGCCYSDLGDVDAHIESLERAADIFVRTNNVPGQWQMARALSGAYQAKGAWEDAIRETRKAVNLARQQGIVRETRQIDSLWGLSDLQKQLRDYEARKNTLEKIAAIVRSRGEEDEERGARVKYERARLLQHLGEDDAANSLRRQLLSVFETKRDSDAVSIWGKHIDAMVIAEMRSCLHSDTTTLRQVLEDVEVILQSDNHGDWFIGWSHFVRGLAFCGLSQFDEAAKCAEAIIEVSQDLTVRQRKRAEWSAKYIFTLCGRHEEIENIMRDGIQWSCEQFGGNHLDVKFRRAELAGFLLNHDASDRIHGETVERLIHLVKQPFVPPARKSEYTQQLVSLYSAKGNTDEARKWQTELDSLKGDAAADLTTVRN